MPCIPWRLLEQDIYCRDQWTCVMRLRALASTPVHIMATHNPLTHVCNGPTRCIWCMYRLWRTWLPPFHSTIFVLQKLADWNGRYEAKFGHVFLIHAAGKSAHTILESLMSRHAYTRNRYKVFSAHRFNSNSYWTIRSPATYLLNTAMHFLFVCLSR